MNKSKRSLRSTLEELAADFAAAAIAAARESLFEFAKSQPPRPQPPARARPEPRARTARAVRSSAAAGAAMTASATNGVAAASVAKAPPRARRSRAASEPAHPSGATDLLITDPQALLTAAFETAGPAGGSSGAAETSYAPVTRMRARREERKEPEILRPVEASARRDEDVAEVVPVPVLRAPALREGEEIVRRSAGGVVLRRRRG